MSKTMALLVTESQTTQRPSTVLFPREVDVALTAALVLSILLQFGSPKAPTLSALR